VQKCDTTRHATDDHRPRRMRILYWIRTAGDTYSEYVILTAFPRKQWLRERALFLPLHTHIVLFYSATARYFSSVILKKLNPLENLGDHGRG